jgi:L-ascorbate metabolism protein UlaG (beta-lactamase superfamily)
MKPAFQQDEALLNQIKSVLNAGSRGLWWLGQSGFLIAQGGRAIVLDPYLSDSLTRKYAGTDRPHVRITEQVIKPAALAELGVIDLITSSHNHTDHLDPETLLPILAGNPQATLAIPGANRDFVLQRLGTNPRIVELDDGKTAEVAGVQMHGVASAHDTVERDEAGRCRFLGYVFKWGGLSFYHSGDTIWHEGLVKSLKPFNVDIAMLPINGSRPERRVAGNLDGREAAQLARDIGAKCVIPCHYDMFAFNTAAPTEFVVECNRLNQSCRVLRNGEGLVF